MVNVRIFVTYKQSVFDPQGETIKDAIHSLGHDEVLPLKLENSLTLPWIQMRMR